MVSGQLPHIEGICLLIVFFGLKSSRYATHIHSLSHMPVRKLCFTLCNEIEGYFIALCINSLIYIHPRLVVDMGWAPGLQ